MPEEYAMQQSWRNDADKLTFIVCSHPVGSGRLSTGRHVSREDFALFAGQQDTPETMLGDVNLFLFLDNDYDEAAGQRTAHDDVKPHSQNVVGEIEIMIARKSQQGKGLGKEILSTFLWYVESSLEAILKEFHTATGRGQEASRLTYLRVKIHHSNTRSITLFQNVGFVLVGDEPNYFGEVELRRAVEAGMGNHVKADLDGLPLIVAYT